jgi:hypothetical protein
MNDEQKLRVLTYMDNSQNAERMSGFGGWVGMIEEFITYWKAVARRKALWDAASVICSDCAVRKELFDNKPHYPTLFHVIEGKGAVDCPAAAIHSLLGKD